MLGSKLSHISGGATRSCLLDKLTVFTDVYTLKRIMSWKLLIYYNLNCSIIFGHWQWIFSGLSMSGIVISKWLKNKLEKSNSIDEINQLHLKCSDTSISNFLRTLLTVVVSASALILRLTLARLCRFQSYFHAIAIYSRNMTLPWCLYYGLSLCIFYNFTTLEWPG